MPLNCENFAKFKADYQNIGKKNPLVKKLAETYQTCEQNPQIGSLTQKLEPFKVLWDYIDSGIQTKG